MHTTKATPSTNAQAPGRPHRQVPQQPRRIRSTANRRGWLPPGLPHRLGSWLTGWLAPRLHERFRLPDRHTPPPHPARLAMACGWAAALGLVGLTVAGRASIAITFGDAPRWFESTVVTMGLLGIGLTIAAFTSLHRRRLPWLLLTAATGFLAINLWLALLL